MCDTELLTFSVDEIIDSKMKFGHYHKRVFAMISLILLADGSEALSLALMLPSIINEFKIDSSYVKIISSMYYVGVLLGALLGGIIADQLGRKRIFVITCFFTATLGFTAVFINSANVFMIIRGSYGILIGIVGPLSISIITESFETSKRGSIFIFCRIFKMVGELIAVFLGFLFLDSNLKSGNWRVLLLVSATPSFLAFALSQKYLIESPRYFLSIKRYDEAIASFKLIANWNSVSFSISSAEELALKRHYLIAEPEPSIQLTEKQSSFSQKMSAKILEIKASLICIISGKYQTLTILIWIVWFCLAFVFYGQTFIFPIILANNNEDSSNTSFTSSPIFKIIVPVLAEIPASYFTTFFIDNPRFGRKFTLFLAMASASFVYFFAFFYLSSLTINFTVARFVLVVGYNVKYTYTSEVYHTSIRSTAVGAASSFGRLGGVAMTYILLSLLEISDSSPVLGLGIICSVGAIATYNFPFDSLKRQLDLF